MVDIITKYICLSIEQFEATLILSLNNRFDQLAIGPICARFLHNYKKTYAQM